MELNKALAWSLTNRAYEALQKLEKEYGIDQDLGLEILHMFLDEQEIYELE